MSAPLGPGQDHGTVTSDLDEPSVATAFGVGLLVGALVLGLVWVSSALLRDDDDPAPTAPLGAVTSPTAQASTTPAPEPVRRPRLERCAAAAGRLAAPLASADPAMDQWRVHVGAMNKLVVGEITLAQATAFWDRTRVGAQRRLAKFHDAGDPVQRRGLDCPTPDRLGRASPELRACAHRVAVEAATWSAARRALRTWAEHVEAMDMLKMGHLSPEDATTLWLASWRRGVQQIDRYRAAATVSRGAGGC